MQCHRAVPRLSSCGDSDPDRFGAIDVALASAKRDEPLEPGRRLPQLANCNEQGAAVDQTGAHGPTTFSRPASSRFRSGVPSRK